MSVIKQKISNGMKTFFGWLATVLSVFTLVLWSQTFDQRIFFQSELNSLASVFFTDSITVSDLRNRYREASEASGKIRIVIVAGHDGNSGGTEFLGVREADLNLALAKKLAQRLNENYKVDTILVRDDNGYNLELEKFLTDNQARIDDFINSKKAVMQELIADGAIWRQSDGVFHNSAPLETAKRLYGINLWANEIKADLVLHIHFNDYPGRRLTQPGEYDGFAIYVPEKQFSNSAASRAVANQIFNRLQYYYPTSNLKKESGGIVEDQSLIAIGSYNTLDAVGILIEYGYIYEERLRYNSLRDKVIDDLALQTQLGLSDFFKGQVLIGERPSAFLPFDSQFDLKPGLKGDLGVLTMQTLLRRQGFYPPFGKDLHDCPLSGNFLGCTSLALANFQNGRSIEGETGFLGPETRELLISLSK